MSSAATTPNLGLPQWVAGEKPERADFNAAFLALDGVTIRGYNANGAYIKFADGTLICLSTLSLGATASVSNAYGSTSGTSYYGYRTWTFPLAFYATPVCGIAATSAAYTGFTAKLRNIGLTTAIASVIANVSDAAATCDLIAIGRWKA